MNKQVCVIGAGPSGIVTVKELLYQKIKVKCFESENNIGGAFKHVKNGGRSYDSLKLTVSNFFMSFSDFMPNQEERKYWNVNEYRDYLKRYIDHYELNDHIYTSHRVISATIIKNKIAVTILNAGKEYIEIFDHLIICSGCHFEPKIPNFNSSDSFKGEILHSSDYVNASSYKGKNVVCIGIGESGADIVHEISQVTSCKVLVRDFPNVIPRWINGYTNDSYTSHCFYSMKSIGINNFMKFKAWYYLTFNKKLSEKDRLIQQWILNRDNFIGKFLTKSDIFIEDVLDGRLEILKDEIKSFENNCIMTKSGDKINAEIIMCNTGYTTNFKNYTFGEEFSNPRKLFKQMIHPKYGTLISLVGWARPTQGGIPSCSEMQARYISLLLAGEKTLPTNSEIEDIIKNDTAYYENLFKDSVDIKSLISYHDYMINLAELIGCKPKLFYWRDLKLSKKLFFGSHISSFYRITEPTTRDKALETIRSLPIAYSKRRSIIILIFTLIFYFVNKFKKIYAV